MAVYLLHLDQPLARGTDPKTGRALVCGHYLGYTENLDERLKHHREGNGSRLMQVVMERGINWQVARVWDGDRKLERRLKNQHNAPRFCPICKSK